MKDAFEETSKYQAIYHVCHFAQPHFKRSCQIVRKLARFTLPMFIFKVFCPSEMSSGSRMQLVSNPRNHRAEDYFHLPLCSDAPSLSTSKPNLQQLPGSWSGEASAPRSTVQRAFRRSLSEVVCSPSLYPQTLQCEILTERLSHINLGNSRSPVSQLSQGVDKVCCQSVSSLSHMLSVSPLSGCCYGSVSIWNCWRVTNTEARWRRSSTGSH